MKVQIGGIAWYRREDYEALKKMFSDGHKLHDSYDEWLEAAEAGFKQLKASGHRVEKVYIEPQTFEGWCRTRSCEINAKARIRFANEVVANIHRSQS